MKLSVLCYPRNIGREPLPTSGFWAGSMVNSSMHKIMHHVVAGMSAEFKVKMIIS